MTINEKNAWINIGIATLWLTALIIVFTSGGTLLFWDIDWMRLAFLLINSIMALSAAAMRVLVENRVNAGMDSTQILVDEREIKIKKSAESKARLFSLIAVVFSVLVLFFYGEGVGGMIPAYFLFFPLIIYVFTYLYSLGVGILILSKRDISYES